MNTAKKDYQIWRARKDAKAAIIVTPETIGLVGNKQNSIMVDQDGIYISGGGSVSFNTTSDNIKQDGLLAQRAGISQMIPTTIVTPASQLIPKPSFKISDTVIKVVATLLTALG